MLGVIGSSTVIQAVNKAEVVEQRARRQIRAVFPSKKTFKVIRPARALLVVVERQMQADERFCMRILKEALMAVPRVAIPLVANPLVTCMLATKVAFLMPFAALHVVRHDARHQVG
jgi:hypothetical protein